MSSFFSSLLIFLSLGVGCFNAWSQTSTNNSNPNGPPFQVLVLNHDTEPIHLGGTLRLGLYNQLGQRVKEQIDTDAASLAGRLKLYLRGFPMNHLRPPITVAPMEAPDAKQPKTKTGPEQYVPTLILEFKLERDSNDEENRKAWNDFLSTIHYGKDEIPVGISLNGGLVYESPNAFTYKTRGKGVITSVLVGSLIVLIGGFVAIYSQKTMLRSGGIDSPYSLGKTQMAWWGLIVATTFASVWIVSGKMERIPTQTLILLGISGATGLGSALIGSGKQVGVAKLDALKKNSDEVQKDVQATEAKAVALSPQELDILEKKRQELAQLKERIAANTVAAPDPLEKTSGSLLRDIISDENGPSFHRLQVVLWTFILGCVFVAEVAHTFSMPEFNETLLLLIGISNSTYLGFKYKEH